MTNEVQTEETPNPYNQKKDWHNEDRVDFVSANEGLYFEEPTERNKLFNSSDITEIEPQGSVNTEELDASKDKPYKRPNYKKRYDDLKKHYDNKLNEFRHREQELIEEATKNRTEYTAPKTEEELEEFKNKYPDVFEVVETVAHMQSESKAKVLEERLSNADDADLASRALDLFKKDLGIEPVKTKSSSKQTKKSAADMVSTKTTSVEPKQQKVWSEREIAAMSMAEFDKYEEDISNAMQEGRIVK